MTPWHALGPLLLAGCGSASASEGSSSHAGDAAPPDSAPPREPVAVVFDTDMGPDIDDAGALAMLHALADAGEVTLLGVVISTSHELANPAIGFVDQVNTYYGRPDVPVGVWKGAPFFFPEDEETFTRAVYAQERFPRDLDDSKESVPDAATLYRRLLAAAPDGSVTVVCTGFTNNLKSLLDSGADGESPLDGVALVRAKVKQLVQMGGTYPGGSEWNFLGQPVRGTTRAVMEAWPMPVLFSGFEIGATIPSGAELVTTPETNPVRAAYAAFFGREGGSRASWDQTAVLAAVRGPEAYWDVVTVGSNRIADDGSNLWEVEPDRDQSYLVKRVADEAIAFVIAELMNRAPRRAGVGG